MSGMGAGTTIHVDGIGELNYQRAIDLARNTEGELNPAVSAYLAASVREIWIRIMQMPDTYILSRDEFAVFNFYRKQFEGNPIAEQAIARFWNNTGNRPFAGS